MNAILLRRVTCDIFILTTEVYCWKTFCSDVLPVTSSFLPLIYISGINSIHTCCPWHRVSYQFILLYDILPRCVASDIFVSSTDGYLWNKLFSDMLNMASSLVLKCIRGRHMDWCISLDVAGRHSVRHSTTDVLPVTSSSFPLMYISGPHSTQTYCLWHLLLHVYWCISNWWTTFYRICLWQIRPPRKIPERLFIRVHYASQIGPFLWKFLNGFLPSYDVYDCFASTLTKITGL